MENKECPKCNISKPINEFGNDKTRKDKLGVYCKKCFNSLNAKYPSRERSKHPDAVLKRKAGRKKERLKKFGISTECYSEMILTQNNSCAICLCEFNKTKRPYIDHCHLSGNVRGLLCINCNVALGHMKDNITNISNMLKYLKI